MNIELMAQVQEAQADYERECDILPERPSVIKKLFALCPDCRALMWGENCTNVQCEQHYNTENRILAEMFPECENGKPQEQVKLLLLFFGEYTQMWYKVKCAALNYCIDQYADTANGYAAGMDKIKARIIALFEERGKRGEI
jgi:hypothetical protein